MTHKIGDMIIPAISKFDRSQSANVKTTRVLGRKFPIIKKIGKTIETANIEAVFYDTGAEHKAKYLEGLADVDYPIYIDSDLFKGWLSIDDAKVQNNNGVIFPVSINAKLLGEGVYKATVKSKKELISNSFVDSTTMQPTIMLPTGAKVLYDGITPKREGLVDIYETDSVELAEGQQITNIKIYDDMGSTNEDDWVLVSNPEKHTFVGNWIIEYGNIRWRSDSVVVIWDGNQWVENGIIDLRYIMYGKLLYMGTVNQKTQPFTIQGNKMKINAHLSRNKDHLEAYKNLEFVFENGYIRCNDGDNLNSVYYNGYWGAVNGIININSDYIVKTQGYETNYTLNSGSDGWVLAYWKNTDIPVICYSSNANIRYSNSNGDSMSNNFYNIPLVNYVGKLFNEAENGCIGKGTIVEDSDASSGYAVQGTGDALNFSIFDTRNVSNGKEVPAGQYKVIFRVKANSTSSNDSIMLYVQRLNEDDTIGTLYNNMTVSASDIGTEYNYFVLDWDYSDADTYGYKIGITHSTNVDGTLFNVDYAIIVPVSEIENIQKRVFCNNNQTVQITPKY